jgi:transposase
MPKSHRKYLAWTPSRIIRWAGQTGPYTQQLVTEIMERRPHPEQGFRACLGVIRLGQRYSPERLENACARAVAIRSYSYKSVDSILKNGLDKQPLTSNLNPAQPVPHTNIRGHQYYHQKEENHANRTDP